ncbi:SH3 domain-containing protein [Vararia minispora EC-137]|uniref:SH3 domain-containing protein n=1 Tax=Vararia minispora EC-137 TaxID=1314806 RepID=A0ACB8QSB3_9AGAM|nr:SH3 domain-containing protein [Vararia minispora EC-137]
MVFSNLSPHEKNAFFSLLDEYFNARPDLLSGSTTLNDSSVGDLRTSATAAAQQAINSNPQVVSALFSQGPKSVATPSKIASKPAVAPHFSPASDEQEEDSAPVSVRSRVAAASQLFNQQTPSAAPRPASSLVSSRKMGDVSLVSSKEFFSSLRNSTANKNAPPPSFPIASATTLPAKKNSLAPPPVRRMTSQSDESPAASSLSSAPPPPPPPARSPGRSGEWAEALYDYDSAEPGDLKISENQRILVTDQSDDDWWRGEVDGRAGLFPASYVQLL